MTDEQAEGATPATPHRLLNPASLGTPWGFSHAVVAEAGRTVYLAGETGHRADDSIDADLVEQFDQAVANVVEALTAAGARPEHVVSMQLFTTDLEGYLAAAAEIGRRYRARFGHHYPAMALVEVRGLVGGAKIEIMCVAQVPSA